MTNEIKSDPPVSAATPATDEEVRVMRESMEVDLNLVRNMHPKYVMPLLDRIAEDSRLIAELVESADRLLIIVDQTWGEKALLTRERLRAALKSAKDREARS